eukprot:g13735.t1
MVRSRSSDGEASATRRSSQFREFLTPTPEFSDLSSADTIMMLCRNHVPQWRNRELHVRKLTEGLTNQLFQVSLLPGSSFQGSVRSTNTRSTTTEVGGAAGEANYINGGSPSSSPERTHSGGGRGGGGPFSAQNCKRGREEASTTSEDNEDASSGSGTNSTTPPAGVVVAAGSPTTPVVPFSGAMSTSSPRPTSKELQVRKNAAITRTGDDLRKPLVAVVLFRIYGKDIHNFYDSENEVQIFGALSKLRIAPRMYAKGEGWRIEEWHFAKPVSNAIMDNPSIYTQVASHLGRFHKLSYLPEFARFKTGNPCVINWLDMWTERALLADKGREESFFAKHPKLTEAALASQKFLKEHLGEKLRQQFLKRQNYNPPERAAACSPRGPAGVVVDAPEKGEHGPEQSPTRTPAEEDITTPIAYRVVFCHNDCQENNVLQTQYGLRLIDFEYSGFNFLGHDLANHFNEWLLDYIVDNPPFFEVKKDRNPTETDLKVFVTVYLSEFLEERISADDRRVTELIESLDVFRLGSHLLWGFWSVLRAPQKQAFDEFDFLEHAKFRFEQSAALLEKIKSGK